MFNGTHLPLLLHFCIDDELLDFFKLSETDERVTSTLLYSEGGTAESGSAIRGHEKCQ